MIRCCVFAYVTSISGLDSLRYGFRACPRLCLSAKPKVGEREVTVTHVTEWIEKKLAMEFQVRQAGMCGGAPLPEVKGVIWLRAC